MRSIMKHNFSQIPKANIQRSSFNRSHGYKTTFDAGYLVPIFVDEALPGDTFNLKMSSFARLATPQAPFMDNLFIDTFFFAVPIRLIWQNWQKFNGEQANPGDSTDFLIPQMSAPSTTGYEVGSLSDYFGIPTGVPQLSHSSLWHRAYNAIWNSWFRDENLQDSVVVDTDDGPDNPTDYVLLKRGKRHDYFTSCLPFPQKGDAVEIPIGDSAPLTGLTPVLGIGKETLNFATGPMSNLHESDGHLRTYQNLATINPASVDRNFIVEENPSHAGYPNIHVDFSNSSSTAIADLSSATASTINQLRQAFQLQRLYERDARGGTRYTEIIRSHFGVVSPDARLQRPEYLGGGSSYVNIHPIAQTSSTDSTSPQGNLAAMGTSSNSGTGGFTKSFTEHCVIIGLACARADLNYQQGLNRMFSRRTRWDFFWPALANIGEQAVLNKEIYAQGPAVLDGDEVVDDQVFGYQERYAEYRYKPSVITGKFRSTYSTPLDMWHLAQKFDSLPALDSSFIEENPPLDRVIAVPSEPHFLYDAFFDLKCARPMPVYGVPGLIDHF